MRRRGSRYACCSVVQHTGHTVLLLLLLAAAVSPSASAARGLQQGSTRCPDLVPGGVEAAVLVDPGASMTVAAYADVGAIYLACASEDADSTSRPSQYVVELVNGEGNSAEALAQPVPSVDGCATTPVVNTCPQPAAVSARVRCVDPAAPCKVRLSTYMSACPGGPQPHVVPLTETGASNSSGNDPSQALAGSSPGSGASNSTALESNSSSGGSGLSTWVIIGVSAAAGLLAALALWCTCRRCCRHRRASAASDSESGLYPQQRPTKQQQHNQQQQFVVSGGGGGQGTGVFPLAVPPLKQQQQQPAAGSSPAGSASTSAGWAFAYKVPRQRLTFATDARRRSGLLQRWETVDGWLAAQLGGGIRAPQGCLLYNDDPPELRPDGSPTGYARPVQYRPCGHAKGAVVWDGHRAMWLVHSVPKWPCHALSSPSGVGDRGLSVVEEPQTQQGQSFLWVVLPVSQLAAVLRQVLHMQALVYFASDARIWPYQPRDYTRSQGRGFSLVQLSADMWHLAKANDPEADFFEELGVRFGGRWLVRTNLTQNQGKAGECPSTPTIINITAWRVPGYDHAPYQAGSEHAKLGVCVGLRAGDNPPRPLVMVGDLNNTYPQWRRGGGGVVVHHGHLSEALRLMVAEAGDP